VYLRGVERANCGRRDQGTGGGSAVVAFTWEWHNTKIQDLRIARTRGAAVLRRYGEEQEPLASLSGSAQNRNPRADLKIGHYKGSRTTIRIWRHYVDLIGGSGRF